jgi:hypothetical protein
MGFLGGYSIRSFAPPAQLGAPPMAAWTLHAAGGTPGVLRPRVRYHQELRLTGSRVTLHIDGVHVASATLSTPLTQQRQVGVWCSEHEKRQIFIRNFRVAGKKPRAFVIMEFSDRFDKVYSDVVKDVCREFGLEPVRADEVYGPGLIISDVIDQIVNSKVIIADITPPNPNVYFEVGYALALNKPIILLAQKSDKPLPFDISGFRVQFYEDSIGGKARVEDGLRKHLDAIRGIW